MKYKSGNVYNWSNWIKIVFCIYRLFNNVFCIHRLFIMYFVFIDYLIMICVIQTCNVDISSDSDFFFAK